MAVAVTKFNPYIELLSSKGGEKLRNIPAIRLEHIFFMKILLVLAHACDYLGMWLLYLQICHPRYGLQQVCVYAKEQPWTISTLVNVKQDEIKHPKTTGSDMTWSLSQVNC